MPIDKTKTPKKYIIVLSIFLCGLLLRVVFAPPENESADPFEVMTAAKTILETGQYLLPSIGSSDLKIHHSFAGWPVGFPLMLSGAFNLFGYSEIVARIFTILLSSLTILCVAVIANQLFSDKVVYLSSVLIAVHPLLISFNGRIFTNNPALLFLTCSLAFLLISTIQKADKLVFVGPASIFTEKNRKICFTVAFFLFGFLLTIRDTEIVYSLIYLFILYKAHFFTSRANDINFKYACGLLGLAFVAFLFGYIPSLYFNYENYGTIITSTHYQWGGRLDIYYLLFGKGSYLGLPGFMVILLCVAAYCFPMIFLFFKKMTDKEKLLFIIFIMLLFPIVIINGAYKVTSTGAAPRYMLPLIPIACLLFAHSFNHIIESVSKIRKSSAILIIILWLFILFYPPPMLFRLSPKFAYAAQYSPVYQVYPYNNYPNHMNVLARWIKLNTPVNAIIIVPSTNPYPFFYYSKRSIISYPNLSVTALNNIDKQTPIYVVGDHESIYDPTRLNLVKSAITDAGLSYSMVCELPLFSPKLGDTTMKIYKII